MPNRSKRIETLSHGNALFKDLKKVVSTVDRSLTNAETSTEQEVIKVRTKRNLSTCVLKVRVSLHFGQIN